MDEKKEYTHLDLSTFNISPDIGFLHPDPKLKLPSKFDPWYELADRIHEDGMTRDKFGQLIRDMPVLSTEELTEPEARIAHRILSHIAFSYVWRYDPTPTLKSFPQSLAIPWVNVSNLIGFEPALNHNDIVLANVAKKERGGRFTFNNLHVLQHCPNKEDDGFLKYIACIEATFGDGLRHIVEGDACMAEQDTIGLMCQLQKLQGVLKSINTINVQVSESGSIDSHRFYYNFLKFIVPWGNELTPYPEGLIYEGVSETPMKITGFSAIQSSIFQTLDAFLGVEHLTDNQTRFAQIRTCMPAGHRKFIETLQERTNVANFVASATRHKDQLTKIYNEVLDEIHAFRAQHMKAVNKYIIVEAKKTGANIPTEFIMRQLKSMDDATVAHKQ